MRAGAFDRLVTFRRRERITPKAGNERGAWQDLFADYGAYRRASGTEVLQGGQAVDLETGLLSVRDSEDARTLTSADRVTIDGRDFAILSVALLVRRAKTIDLQVSTRSAG